jgi:serine/threonine-protein kinase
VARCPTCGAPVDDVEESCPSCRTPLPWNAGLTRLADDPDATRLEPPSDSDSSDAVVSNVARGDFGSIDLARGVQTRDSRSRERNKNLTSSSGWLSSTDAIDHGRFSPGALLDGRYRIIERAGKGGMGEVYRADDLKLGQPVALKFLPEAVDRDPARLTQLHAEVRMARQVSHPNVCRVYDVDEFEGHTFLSMEYVDGEDLATLLRRIGRFPQDRAIELARQLCAGLAAAHDRGVVHRDLKPANIMLDGSGRIRITDFGLAGASGESLRAGTPAYMAPEQIAGQEITPRSDVYALGLVLYEMFTGQRALEAQNLAELIAKREQAAVPPPTALVRDLDPAIERIIFRCLESDPRQRPASALAVAAALPGGDPLAAALAAGETPSPEMVAAAAQTEAVASPIVIGNLAWIALSLVVVVVLFQRFQLLNQVDLPKVPAALQDRAAEIAGKLGYGGQIVSSASGLGLDLDWARSIDATHREPGRWSMLSTPRPVTVNFWFRTSPRLLVPAGRENNIAGLNPPLSVSGMTLMVLDTAGHLMEFHAVPDPVETAASASRKPANWSMLFDAAGLPITEFTEGVPRWVPLAYSDERKAWDGRLPERPEIPIRVEASAFAGRPVFFVVTGTWDRSSRGPQAAVSRFTASMADIANFVMPAMMVIGLVLARRQMRLKRGDRVGAFRAATITFVISLAAWMFSASHVPSFSAELNRIFGAVAKALFEGGLLWLIYLGVEPYVRRLSPDSLIGWTRLIGGHWRDPHVGRDVLIGVSAGMLMTLFFAVHNLLPPLIGQPEPMPFVVDPQLLAGQRFGLAYVLRLTNEAIQSAMLGTVGFVVLGMLLRRWWAAILVSIVVFTPVAVNGMFAPGTPLLDLVLGALIITVFFLIVWKFGLLAGIAALTTHFLLSRAPIATNPGIWWAPVGLAMLGLLLAATIAAASFALGKGVQTR